MSRRTIKDKQSRTIGYIDTQPDGRWKAMDASFRTVGTYDPKLDVTLDDKFRTVAMGDILSSLIVDSSK